mgnify:CR=1 FL=1
MTTFSEQDKLEQQFLDANGRILLSTSGLSGGGLASTEDATQALATQKTSVFTGRDPLSDERVMSVTAPLLSSRGDLVGGVRFITSLRVVERQIWIIIGVSLLACLVFLIFVVASNSYFIRSIVDPVLKINNIAKEIAAGRYGVRLQKTYDDEIGELCDTINYMSDEINRAERMKNDFISSVSHELRTPLAVIQTTGELLLDSPNSRIVDRFEDVNAITSETKRLARLVDNLMELSLGDAGRSSLDASAVNLDALVREACAAYEDFATLQDKRLEVETGSRETIEADADKLRQLLGIVLDNALKYTAPGDEITVRTRASGPKQCVVEVADTGCGIDPEDRAHVFERFYRADKARSRETGGYGLGLSLAQHIVEAHGGSIALEPNEPRGTVVVVTLPANASKRVDSL